MYRIRLQNKKYLHTSNLTPLKNTEPIITTEILNEARLPPLSTTPTSPNNNQPQLPYLPMVPTNLLPLQFEHLKPPPKRRRVCFECPCDFKDTEGESFNHHLVSI